MENISLKLKRSTDDAIYSFESILANALNGALIDDMKDGSNVNYVIYDFIIESEESFIKDLRELYRNTPFNCEDLEIMVNERPARLLNCQDKR